MKQSTRDYFTNKRWAFDYMLSQECVPSREKGMPGEVYALIQEEFDPGYINDTQCPPCCFTIIKDGFRMFDEAVKREKETKPLIVAANFPKNDPPEDENIHEDRVGPGFGGAEFEKAFAKIAIDVAGQMTKETPEQRKARLADPNRVIKRRAKRK